MRRAELRRKRNVDEGAESRTSVYRFTRRSDLSVGIADFVTFVENEVVPLVRGERFIMNENIRVRCDENAGGRRAHFVDQTVLQRRSAIEERIAGSSPTPFLPWNEPLSCSTATRNSGHH